MRVLSFIVAKLFTQCHKKQIQTEVNGSDADVYSSHYYSFTFKDT